MGPPPSQEQMIEMLSNPAFSQMMNEALQNPAMIDMMIQQNPQLREMGPAGRQFLQSEQFRRMVTDPQSLRAMSQLQAAMGMGPFGGMGGGGGQEAFPAPGITNTTPTGGREAGSESQDADQNNNSTNPAGTGTRVPAANPFAAIFGMPPPTATQQTTNTTTPPQNPFAALLGMPPTNQNQQQPGQQGTDAANNPSPVNPFLNIQNNPLFQNPDLMNQFVQAMGGGGGVGGAGAGNLFGGNTGGANPLANLGSLFGGAGMGGLAAPADNRPPEARYATQLRQLNEMGFFDFDRNIQALQRSGGDVSGALEWLFSQP
jgi:ubiquilin